MLCIFYHNIKTTKHVTICLPFLYSGKGKEQAHYRGQNLLPDAKQSCSLISVPIRCRHEAKAKDGISGVSRFLACPLLKNSSLSLCRLQFVCGLLCPSPQQTLWKLLFFFREICLTSTPTTHTLLGNMETDTYPQRKRDFQK